MFQAEIDPQGMPLLHSTSLKLGDEGFYRGCDRVSPMERGIVEGTSILLPRVGAPSKKNLRLWALSVPVQLSDCVIALGMPPGSGCSSLLEAMLSSFEDLLALYRGTGARYITVERLVSWLGEIGFEVVVSRNALGPTITD